MLLVTPCGFGDTGEGSTCDRAEGTAWTISTAHGVRQPVHVTAQETLSHGRALLSGLAPTSSPPVFSELKQRSSLTAPCLITCSYKHSRGRIQRSVLLLDRGGRVNKALPVLNPGARWGQAPRPPQGACTVLPGLPRLAP